MGSTGVSAISRRLDCSAKLLSTSGGASCCLGSKCCHALLDSGVAHRSRAVVGHDVLAGPVQHDFVRVAFGQVKDIPTGPIALSLDALTIQDDENHLNRVRPNFMGLPFEV